MSRKLPNPNNDLECWAVDYDVEGLSPNARGAYAFAVAFPILQRRLAAR